MASPSSRESILSPDPAPPPPSDAARAADRVRRSPPQAPRPGFWGPAPRREASHHGPSTPAQAVGISKTDWIQAPTMAPGRVRLITNGTPRTGAPIQEADWKAIAPVAGAAFPRSAGEMATPPTTRKSISSATPPSSSIAVFAATSRSDAGRTPRPGRTPTGGGPGAADDPHALDAVLARTVPGWICHGKSYMMMYTGGRARQGPKRSVAREGQMAKVVEAVFENGVFKPLESVELQEHQRVRVAITLVPGAVNETRGMIQASPADVEEVAESDEYLAF